MINTCCVTNEAVAKSRQAASRAARTHRTRLRHRLRREPRRRRRSLGLPANVRVIARRSEELAEAVARDVGAIGCVQAAHRLDRVRAFVKIQDGCSFSCRFCVIPLVRGATRSRSADGRARRDRAPGRAGSSRDRAHRRQSRLLPRPRRPATRSRGSSARPARSTGSSGCGSPRSRSTTSPTSSSRRCARRRPSRRTSTSRCSRETTACCARWAAATRSAQYLAEARGARGLQPHDRRDRRLPGRGRGGVRAHACDVVERARHHEGARVPVLAAARDADRGRRPCAAAGQEGARRPPPRGVRRRLPDRCGSAASARRTGCSSTARAAATPTTTRRGSSTPRSASSSALGRRASPTRGWSRLASDALASGLPLLPARRGAATTSTRPTGSSRSPTSPRRPRRTSSSCPRATSTRFATSARSATRRRAGCCVSWRRRRPGQGSRTTG